MLKFLVSPRGDEVHWPTVIIFSTVPIVALGIFFVETHWRRDLVIGVSLYAIWAFCLTAGFHRYFAHRTYKMGRVMQFAMALGATSAGQRGPLWWAANHRNHHKHSDDPDDVHSPKDGFWWGQVGWFFAKRNQPNLHQTIPDFEKFPELRWLDRHYTVPGLVLGILIYFCFSASAVFVAAIFLLLLQQATFAVNTVAHLYGSRRFATADTSRNNAVLALLTSGEGWHNNHHHYPQSSRQGFYWWEIDVSYYGLKILSWVGLVRDLHVPAQKVLERHLTSDVSPAEFKALK